MLETGEFAGYFERTPDSAKVTAIQVYSLFSLRSSRSLRLKIDTE